MTTEQEIQHLARTRSSPLSPALAVRLRAVAARVAHQEDWVLDEMAAEGLHVARLAWQERKRAAEARRATR